MKKIFLCALISMRFWAQGQEIKPQDKQEVKTDKQEDYYKISTLALPEHIILEGGGMVTLPNGSLAICTRRGQVWIVDNPEILGSSSPRYHLYAEGLHEPLGMVYLDGDLLVAQRGEITKLSDKDGDGMADTYENIMTIPISGHYHEYAFGPVRKKNGDMFVTLNVSFGNVRWWEAESNVPFRGWTLKRTPDGKVIPFAAGMRSPAGIGLIDDEVFYTENQGDWAGSGWLMHVEEGNFIGNPAGLAWSGEPNSPVKIKKGDIVGSDRPMFETAMRLPGFKMPAVWFPHTILGISTSDILVNNTQGKFAPYFDGQVFIGDQGHSKVNRVFLEKINGQYQGACFQFVEGFASGVLRMCWGKQSDMFVGQTNRGWASTGKEPFALQKLSWTGKTPFEIKAIRAKSDGFELEFTKPVDTTTACNIDNYLLSNFTYKYHATYGSPIIDQKSNPVIYAKVLEGGYKVRLLVDSLRKFYIHEVKTEGLLSTDGYALLHPTGYYTLNQIPEGDAWNIDRKALNNPAIPCMGLCCKKKSSLKGKDKTAASTSVLKTTGSKEEGVAHGILDKKPLKVDKNPSSMPESWNGAYDMNITIGTKHGLQYDIKEIKVKAGAKIKLTFANGDDMLHNLVLVLPGTAIEVGNAAMNLGLKAEKMNYVPNSSKVLFHTKLLQPESEETIYFEAPSKPADYTYVCTFPGHAFVMQGILKVSK